ncbi:MAG TPA: uroporphyrinogen-III synthase [Sphingomicrobium sp.]
MRRLVVLRPEPGATQTMRRARALGFEAVAMPLFAIEPVAWEAPEIAAFDGLLLTSANAVRCAGDALTGLRSLPVHAVGDATAQAARGAGFEVATTGGGDIDELLAILPDGTTLLHLCGEHKRQPTVDRHSIVPIAVYTSKALDAPANAAPLRGSVALVHSSRAGARLREVVELAKLDRREIAIAAISPAAAESAGPGWATIEAAGEPTDAALLALAARLCNNFEGA